MSPTRRVFLVGAAGSCLVPRSTWAQQAKATPHIGWISIEAQPDPFIEGFREGLRRHGYLEGTNVILDMSLEIAGKRVELIEEVVPRLRTLAVLSNVDHPGEPSERRATEAAAHPIGVTIAYVPFSSIGQLDRALDTVRQARPDAMIVFPEGTTLSRRVKIAEFAVAHRLPSMFGWSEYVDAGGFISYGANQRAPMCGWPCTRIGSSAARSRPTSRSSNPRGSSS